MASSAFERVQDMALNFVATSRTRVEDVSRNASENIRMEMKKRLDYFVNHKDEIGSRLKQLDLEWDVERALIVNASALAFVSLLFGFRWFPMLVMAFLFHHGIQGWCPPLVIFRSIGLRTQVEIMEERQALKAIRGDYDKSDKNDPNVVFEKTTDTRLPQ